MFHFFKNKSTYDLSWLHTDMHSHLLPGIDDGSPDAETSIRLIRGLRELGYERLYMTPHILPGVHPNNSQTIAAAFEELKVALPEDISDSMYFATAAEHMVDLEFEVKTIIADNCLLPDKRILIEMSYLSASPNIDQVIYDLQMKGYQPILAHPERYPYYFNNPGRYEQIRDQGCLLQCNLLSFTGYYGKPVQKMAQEIASRGLIDYLGTDMHHDRHLRVLSDFYTKNDSQQLFYKCQILNSKLN